MHKAIYRYNQIEIKHAQWNKGIIKVKENLSGLGTGAMRNPASFFLLWWLLCWNAELLNSGVVFTALTCYKRDMKLHRVPWLPLILRLPSEQREEVPPQQKKVLVFNPQKFVWQKDSFFTKKKGKMWVRSWSEALCWDYVVAEKSSSG